MSSIISTSRKMKSRCIVDNTAGNLHDHLLSAQQSIANELARAQGDGCVGHDGLWLQTLSSFREKKLLMSSNVKSPGGVGVECRRCEILK